MIQLIVLINQKAVLVSIICFCVDCQNVQLFVQTKHVILQIHLWFL